MYFSLPLGMKLMVENETTDMIEHITFYANGALITGAEIKRLNYLREKVQR